MMLNNINKIIAWKTQKDDRKIIERDFNKFFNNTTGRKKEYVGDLITIKARNIKNCSLQISDKFGFKFNMVPDQEYGIIRTIFRISYYGEFKVIIGDKGFNTLLILGLNREKKVIEKVYAIPQKELDGNKCITITTKGQKYQKFRIDEKPYDKIYQYMKTGNYSILEDDGIIKIRNMVNIKRLNDYDKF